MPAYGYEFYLLVVNSISHSFAALTREISSWPEDKIHIHARACNILYISELGYWSWSTTPLCLLTCERLAIVFYLEHVETMEITVKLLQIKHTFRNISYSKQWNFASPSNINHFGGIENGGGRSNVVYYLVELIVIFSLLGKCSSYLMIRTKLSCK